MGAKRAVPGRTASYDTLLLEWQRKTNPNSAAVKKSALPSGGATATAADGTSTVGGVVDVNASGSPPKKARRLPGSQNAAGGGGATKRGNAASKVEANLIFGEVSDTEGSDDFGDGDDDDGGFDSEEEVEQVLAGLTCANAGGRPFPGLQKTTSMFAVRDVRISRYRDSLASVLSVKSPTAWGPTHR